MGVFKARRTIGCPAELVLDALTDPDACGRWSPLPFSLEGIDSDRLHTGARATISGSLAGRGVRFDVEIDEASPSALALHASGPVDFDVLYEIEDDDGRSDVALQVATRGRGLTGRVLATVLDGLMAGGALQEALRRIERDITSQGAPALAV